MQMAFENRSDFHAKLVALLGSNNVYYQPPENYKLVYPCLIYELSGLPARYADDSAYFQKVVYQVTCIDKDPDSEIPSKLLTLKGSKYDRHFVNDNLHHTVFTVELF